MKFEELEFKTHPMVKDMMDSGVPVLDDFKDMKQALYPIKEGLKVSVVVGKLAYSNGKDTYEVWVIGDKVKELPNDDFSYSVPTGYLSKTEVENYIKRVISDAKA